MNSMIYLSCKQIPSEGSEEESISREFRDHFERTGVMDHMTLLMAKAFEEFKDTKTVVQDVLKEVQVSKHFIV